MASWTSSATDRAPIFFIKRARRSSTVRLLSCSSAAISLLSFPSMTRFSTARSPSDNRARRSSTRWRRAPRRRLCASSSKALRMLSQSFLFVEGFFQEINRACLHGAYGHLHIAVAGDKNYRQIDLVLNQFALQFQAVKAGHGDVEHQAAGTRGLEGGQKLGSRAVGFYLWEIPPRPRPSTIATRPDRRRPKKPWVPGNSCLFSLSVDRQGKAERHAPFGIPRRFQASAVGFHDRSADRKPQPHARLFCGIKRLENLI